MLEAVVDQDHPDRSVGRDGGPDPDLPGVRSHDSKQPRAGGGGLREHQKTVVGGVYRADPRCLRVGNTHSLAKAICHVLDGEYPTSLSVEEMSS